MNGTSKAALMDDLETVYVSIQRAIDSLKQAAPNQRDYYPLPINWWEEARTQHRRRLQILADLQDELTEELRLIDTNEPHNWSKYVDERHHRREASRNQ